MDRETRTFAENHFRRLQRHLPSNVGTSPGRVDFIEKPDSFSYTDFFKGYLLPNVPCVFSSAFTEGWGSRKHWVTSSGKPNFDYLLQNYGDAVVPVANCGVREFNSNPKEHMPLRDYITYWKEFIQGDYSSLRGCLYLKDWHVCRDFSAKGLFTLPVYFSSDWLNEYWDALDVDDYRFIYMGPTGTWSPFHADIFRSFSWSVNICGRKKWLLFPPGQEEALRDCHGGLPYDVTAPEFWDSHQHPMLEHCNPPLEVTQEAGEMLFVPSGWHHQVHNLVIMKSCSGINFEEFYCFLKIIAERRLLLAKKIGSSELECGEGSGLGPQQVIFDIGRIAEVLASVVVNPDFQRVDTSIFSLQPEDLLQQLKDVLAAMESV
ncbi:2-oxoglutarate and iron-dependent oxygenase JMJD4 isoform X5 [Saccopteryx leptura]|uniref:2-oxoglutarate and iron-dependent oxygenase JMJD4 isoform X5 n=1 Tax=Saccopteryx leptura TaxID=249018 RepID=UPI00339C0076